MSAKNVETKGKKQNAKVKSETSVADLRNKSVEELQKLLATARKDLLELQKSLRANELANPHAVTKMRKEIARIMTVLAEKRHSELDSESSNNNITKGDEKIIGSRIKSGMTNEASGKTKSEKTEGVVK